MNWFGSLFKRSDGRRLWEAATAGDVTTARQCLEGGVDALSINGAFLQGCNEGQVEVVKLLLSHGADVRSQSTADQTAMRIAVLRNHVEIVRLLVVDHGVDPNEECLGQAVLFTAASMGHHEIAELLLELGADPNKQSTLSGNGFRPLDGAVTRDDATMVRLLLQHGADVTLGLMVGSGSSEEVRSLLANAGLRATPTQLCVCPECGAKHGSLTNKCWKCGRTQLQTRTVEAAMNLGLTCSSCGRKYVLGKTGCAVSARVAVANMAAGGVAVFNFTAPEGDPDAISPVGESEWNDAMRTLNDRSVHEILADLAAGKKRRWNCRACNHEQDYDLQKSP